MTDSFLEKLKKSVLAGAQTSATKIEEAAAPGRDGIAAWCSPPALCWAHWAH